MTYPPGIILRPVTIGGATTLESGEQLSLAAEIRSSRGLMWGATGWQFHAVPRTITGSAGEELTFSLPVTDLTGWRLLDSPGSVIDVSAPGSYTHTYTIKLTTSQSGRAVAVRTVGPFVLPTEDLSLVDLDLMLPVGTQAGGVALVPDTLSARLNALEQGGGVDVGQAVEDYLAANPPAGTGGSGVTADNTPTVPAEGQSASYLVTSSVSWPTGLVWSTDPDGGVAPTITGTALVSLFTVDGTTRAIMGATFPGAVPPPDTTAPVAGMLAVAPSSTSALGTVTGASDAVALDAAPYSFRLDAGAWSAWQASASYTWTGLTASTSYTFQHRVRDAAGNVSTGAEQTVTTTAAGEGSSFDAAVLALSPVAYWPMEETSGATINDITGNGHHLTHGGVEGVDFIRTSTGTQFTTNLGAATCPTAPRFNLETAGFSVLMIPDRELGSDKTVFQKGEELKVQSGPTAYYAGYRASNKWVKLSYSADDVVSFAPHMMTVTAPAAATGAVPLHYINGNASVGAISGSAAWVTGRDGDITVGSFANGKYRKLAFFNRQLTPTEIASLYAAAQAEGLVPA